MKSCQFQHTALSLFLLGRAAVTQANYLQVKFAFIEASHHFLENHYGDLSFSSVALN